MQAKTPQLSLLLYRLYFILDEVEVELAKLDEDIENMNKVQAEAIKSTGAKWSQWINYGVQPQVMPRLIGLSMYRLDINFRESAILGLVGTTGAVLSLAEDHHTQKQEQTHGHLHVERASRLQSKVDLRCSAEEPLFKLGLYTVISFPKMRTDIILDTV